MQNSFPNLIANPWLHSGLPDMDSEIPFPSISAENPATLLRKCPSYTNTPLVSSPGLASACNITSIHIKDERGRFGLGSFKALGAAYVVASDASSSPQNETSAPLEGITYVTASAGNHGLSVAAGAALFGAKSVIYISQGVPESFAERLREKQAVVVRRGETYEESMQAASQAARDNGWKLLSDSSWPGYYQVPHQLMEGYLQIAKEVGNQIDNPPSHIFLQAGVGGFAGAMAAYARHLWGNDPIIVVVEPEAAPALIDSIKSGHAVVTAGPASNMGRLDCKEPSLIALKGLARDANYFLTASDHDVASVLPLLEDNNMSTSPSGAAGFAALYLARSCQSELQLTPHSSALIFITEGAEL